MKRLAVIISAFLLCGCGRTEIASVPESAEETTVETAIETTTETTETTTETTAETSSTGSTSAAAGSARKRRTTTAETTIVTETTSAVHETIERKVEVDEETFRIIEAVENGYHFEPYNIFDGTNSINYENEIYFYVDEVSKVPNDTLGEIVDEADLIAKAREVFIAVSGQELIDRAEAEYVERDGEQVAIVERTTPVYSVMYYEEYDVWRINPCMPSGVLENGVNINSIFDNPPFLIVKGDSGKIIGCRF